ncbi:hypothetical protein [Metabacillus fastidiosus]|uniref:Uncharacterized protein n=1 Tax=Metabacillus fastidiosus TaxID=1458 RepID=A0ABU6NRI2_9BACI|nr:hypothetical protein [Metabacillus fastidiosus]
MEKIVQDHEQRILALEQNYSTLSNKMQAVETGQMRIENTLLRESREQKELINKQRDEQDELFDTLVKHTLGIKKNNSNKKWELALAVVGGGGLLYAVFEILITRL